LIEVPEPVARTAALALQSREERRGGGTARGVVLATSLAMGRITAAELGELHRWHRHNGHAFVGDSSTLLGGLYGGRHARSWLPAIAAAANPAGVGAMIALPVDPAVADRVALDDGEPADEMHLTLFHLGSDAASLDQTLHEAYAAVLAKTVPTLPIPGIRLSHIERFSATDEGLEPVALVADDPSVYELRQGLQDALDAAGLPYSDDHAFRCHLTLGYYAPGDGPEAGPVDTPVDLAPQLVALHWAGDVTDTALAQAPKTASASRDLSGVSTQLNEIDRKLVAKLHAAANVAFEEAIRQARVKVQVRGSRNPKMAAVLQASGGVITPALMAAVGVTENELLDKRFDVLGAAALREIRAAELRKIKAAARAADLDWGPIADDLEPEVEKRSVAAVVFLVGALGLLARQALSGHAVTPDEQGEFAGPVPFSLIRETWRVAAQGAAAPAIDDTGPGPGGDIEARAADAAQSFAEQIIGDNLPDGETLYALKTWRHGDPLKPFEPHQRLGDEEASWTDADHGDILAADPNEFPYVSEYEPGDHDGCTCWIDTTYVTEEGLP
jgi:2'-5' RNA ligase